MPPARPKLLAAVFMVIGLGLSACGGEPEGSESQVREAVEESFTDYENLAHRGPGDWCDTRIILNSVAGDDLYRRLSQGVRGGREERVLDEKIEETNEECERWFEEDLPDEDLDDDALPGFEELEITDIAFQGSTATARVSFQAGGEEDSQSTLNLINDNDGHWRMTINEMP